MISIHALREEGDPWSCGRCRWRGYFYPRPPRGGRLGRSTFQRRPCSISIHALREEGDLLRSVPSKFCRISIHALREEGDPDSRGTVAIPYQFLSTPSARRATRHRCSNNYV